MPNRPRIIIALCLFAQCMLAHAAEPGLILKFSDTDARAARQASLYVPKGEAPSAFTPAGQPVRATWQGTLNLEARSRLIFTLEGTGKATLSIDDEILCEKIGTASERKRLSSGEHPIKIEYTGPADGDAQLRLFWEGRDFGKEPVPASAFTHDASDPTLSKQSQLRLGHELIAQYNCNHCHGESKPGGMPSLDGPGTRFETAWLAQWIKDPQAHRASARMPKLFDGEDAAQKAADIAHFLAPPESAPPGPAFPITPDMIKAGGKIFHEQGCIACHTLDPRGDADRIGLGDIAHKYRHFAISAFLRAPSKHHGDTRMPDFGFDEAEGNSLEAYLRSLTKTKGFELPKGDKKRGGQLFKQDGCLNCHEAGDATSQMPPPKPATSADCTKAHFALSEIQKQAITAALNDPRLPQRIPAEIAPRHFTTMRCAACHERDGQQAYRDTFEKEVEHLVPPAEGPHSTSIPQLTHLGAKLRPEWRSDLFRGEIKPKTRPWLKARMPAFASRAETLSTGFSHSAGLPAEHPPLPAPDAEKVRIGAALAGTTGFACATCHGIGDQKAIAVFEGEGPNFRDAGPRLLAEYFQLWMSDPPRVWPGTIMPKYTSDNQSPLTQHYEGDAAKQFEAIYDYIRSLKK